jgi:hypothetical protein
VKDAAGRIARAAEDGSVAFIVISVVAIVALVIAAAALVIATRTREDND